PGHADDLVDQPHRARHEHDEEVARNPGLSSFRSDRREGEGAKEAAINGRSEVQTAAIRREGEELSSPSLDHEQRATGAQREASRERPLEDRLLAAVRGDARDLTLA